MPEHPIRRKIEVYRLYFKGLSYDNIVKEMERRGKGVAKGTVVDWIKQLKEGRFKDFEGLRGEVDALRELSVDLRKSALTVLEALAGINFYRRISELGVEPHILNDWVGMCKKISVPGYPLQSLVEAAVRLSSMEEKEGKGADEIVKELEGEVQRLKELKSEVEGRLMEMGINPNDKEEVKKLVEFSKRLDVVEKGLSEVKAALSSIPISNIYEKFKCDHCGSKHLIAIKFKCTKCGSESWWGYWPKKS